MSRARAKVISWGRSRALLEATLVTVVIVVALPLMDRLSPRPAIPDLARTVETMAPPPPPPPPALELPDTAHTVAAPLPRLDAVHPSLDVIPPTAAQLPVLAVGPAVDSLVVDFAVRGDARWATAGLVFDVRDADQPPQPLARFAPLYPPRARLRRIEGEVQVEFVVTATGGVEDPVVVHAEPADVFEGPALQAIRRWRFEPGRKGGQAVAVRVRQKLTFTLDEDGP